MIISEVKREQLSYQLRAEPNNTRAQYGYQLALERAYLGLLASVSRFRRRDLPMTTWTSEEEKDLEIRRRHATERWNLEAHLIAQAVLNGDITNAAERAEKWAELRTVVEDLQAAWEAI